MAQIQPATPGKPGKKMVRYGVPVAIAGLAAATIGLVPALADSGDPDLPEISAEKLLARMATADTDQLSGTVKIKTDLGLPGFGGGRAGGPLFGGGADRDEERGEGGRGGKRSGADPQRKLAELATGEHTLRVAIDGPRKQRLWVEEEASEFSYLRNGNEVWTYDSASDTAFHAVGPKDKRGGKHHKRALPKRLADGLTPQQAAKRILKAVDDTTDVSVDGTSKVAGRDAYRLVIKPAGAAHSTVDSVRIAVDAEHGVPLKFTLDPVGRGPAAVDVGFTRVDFGKPSAETFRFTPPKGTDVTERRFDGARAGKDEVRKGAGHGEHGKKRLERLEKLKELKKLEGLRESRGPKGLPGLQGGSGLAGLTGLDLLGKGWGTVVTTELPGAGLDRPGRGPSGKKSPQMDRLLDVFSDSVKGDFGTARVFSSKLVNVMVTDDGTVYAGAVTKEGLVKAAEKAEKKDRAKAEKKDSAKARS